MKFVIYIEICFEFHWKQACFQSSFSHCKMNRISHFWNYLGKSHLTDMLHHMFASGLVSYNFCMIPLVWTWDLGCSNSGKALLQCDLLNSELVHPKFQAQASGIIQKLYETKPDANMWCSISVNWLFPQIIPKLWDSVHFTVWKWALKMGLFSMKFKINFNVNHKFHPIWMSFCILGHFLQKNCKNGGNLTFLALSQKKVSWQIWITLYLC